MPQIQVLDREDPSKSPYNTFAEQLRQQQETVSNVMYKKAQVEYNKELAKLEVRKADSETAKFKSEQDAKDWEIAGTIISQAEKASKQPGGNYDMDRWNKLTSQWVLEAPPGVGKKLAMLAKAGPQAQVNPKDAYQQESANLLQQMQGGRAGAVAGQGVGQGNGMVTKGINYGPEGATINTINPQADALQNQITETGKMIPKVQVGLGIVDQLKQQWEAAYGTKGSLPAPEKGMGRFAHGARAGWRNMTQGDTKVASYETSRTSKLTPLVKALGDVGAITANDRAAIEKLIPTGNTSALVAKANFKALADMLSSALTKAEELGFNVADLMQQAKSLGEEFTIKVKK